MLYLCAVLTWITALAIIFPPGALVVGTRPLETKDSLYVPMYDPTYMGRRTTRDLQFNALFLLTEFGAYL